MGIERKNEEGFSLSVTIGKPELLVAAILLIIFSAIKAFAQEVPPPTADDWLNFLKLLPSLKDAGTVAAIIVVVQGLLLIGKSQFIKLDGKLKLIVVFGLTWVVGILSLKQGGADWASAVFHVNSIAAFQVFLHQLKQQWFPKKK